jgi:hypothetical protein
VSSRTKWIEKWSRQADCNDAITDMRVGSKECFANALLNGMKKPEKNTTTLLRRLDGSGDDHVMCFDCNMAESHSSKRDNLKKRNVVRGVSVAL